MRILALDVGTSSVKAAILDAGLAVPLGPIARVGYSLDHPTPEANEVPAQRLWLALTAAAREATRNDPEGIEGVGLSCLTPALVLLDEADKPLVPVWVHLDRRSRQAARQVQADVGEEFLATTGNRPLPGGISAICWRQLLTHDPYLSQRVHSYLHLNSWFTLSLTGNKAFDPANATFSGLFGTLTDQKWSQRWCQYFDVDPNWLPPIVSGNTTVGTLRSGPAVEMGLPGGLPVKLGTADTSSAMLAAGMVSGDLLHVVGTTQVLSALTDLPVPDPRRLTRRLGIGEAFVHVTHNPVGGAALTWLRELCFREQSEKEFFQNSVPAARQRETRVTLDPPFLGGDRLEIEAHRAAFRNLTLTTDRMDLLAALLNALRKGHQMAVTALGLGDRFQRVFLTGGAAEVVRQIIPEYAEIPVHILEEGSLRGVARLFQPP